MQTLTLWAEGQDVLNAQCRLAETGFYSGDLDGYFGPQTEAAVIAFQKQEQMTATGEMDPATAAALKVRDTGPIACEIPNITAELVAPMLPDARLRNVETNLPYVLSAVREAKLCDKRMLVMALATIRAETPSFLPISEFQSPFNTSAGGHPFDLYDFRAGLGNQGPPDGANFRGRGFVQLTGRANYRSYGQTIGEALVQNPMLAHEPEIAAKLLAGFLKAHESEIRAALSGNNLAAARRLVNGGANGLVQFEHAFYTGMKLIPEIPGGYQAEKRAA
jgi:putative chitinase